jgi:hypothetical protein
MDVVTCALVESIPLVPGQADGSTLDEGYDEENDGVNPAYSHDTVCDCPKALCRKNAKVEEEDGDLGDTQASDVKDLPHEVVKQDVGDLIGLQRPYVSPKTVLYHYGVVSKLG